MSAERMRWSDRNVMQRPRRLLQDSANTVSAMFPSLPDTTNRFAISRARNGCESNPLYRLASWLWDAAREGQDVSVADRAIAFLEAHRDLAWQNDYPCFIKESEAEQGIDGVEDVVQQKALLNPGAIPAYIEVLDDYILRARRLRRAAVLHYEEQRRD